MELPLWINGCIKPKRRTTYLIKVNKTIKSAQYIGNNIWKSNNSYIKPPKKYLLIPNEILDEKIV